jgi:hypothetical protein
MLASRYLHSLYRLLQVILDRTTRSVLLCLLTDEARGWITTDVRYRVIVRVPAGDDSCGHPASRCNSVDDFVVTASPLIQSIAVNASDSTFCEPVYMPLPSSAFC